MCYICWSWSFTYKCIYLPRSSQNSSEWYPRLGSFQFFFDKWVPSFYLKKGKHIYADYYFNIIYIKFKKWETEKMYLKMHKENMCKTERNDWQISQILLSNKNAVWICLESKDVLKQRKHLHSCVQLHIMCVLSSHILFF